MKKISYLFVVASLLLAIVGCSSTDKPAPSGPVSEPDEPSEPVSEPVEPSEPAPEPIALGVSDLEAILSSLDTSDAVLTYYGENEDTRPANAAIRSENYVKELQDYTWESYQVPVGWNINDDYRCAFTSPGLSLIAYQSGPYRSGYGNDQPLHVITENGEGWFIQSTTSGERDGETSQFPRVAFEALKKWYQEAQAADLYQGAGTPLTAEELTWFQEYTVSINNYYYEEWDRYSAGSTAISCFFTSKYSDPRDMAATEFLSYCPSQGELGAEDEEEFQLVQEKLDWRSGADDHLLSITEMPIPCHRLPRAYVNEILTQYAGITVEDMHTDWEEEGLYIPETDCFYTFTSDFGPGTFVPYYGEKEGDTVTLWEIPNFDNDYTVDALILRKSDENWLILSHQVAE